ncbi:hypothetical protein PULV_b0025 [Pseudoalteromonas ulvae UL12]|nr:hypothetical protein [Pseudoalteromonas ulvae UL12]
MIPILKFALSVINLLMVFCAALALVSKNLIPTTLLNG